MVECAAEQAVELFEESNNKSLRDVLNIVKRKFHLTRAEFARVKRLTQDLLTWEMLDPQRAVDVC